MEIVPSHLKSPMGRSFTKFIECHHSYIQTTKNKSLQSKVNLCGSLIQTSFSFQFLHAGCFYHSKVLLMFMVHINKHRYYFQLACGCMPGFKRQSRHEILGRIVGPFAGRLNCWFWSIDCYVVVNGYNHLQLFLSMPLLQLALPQTQLSYGKHIFPNCLVMELLTAWDLYHTLSQYQNTCKYNVLK